ncbi:MAG: protein kinase [Myxococcales bacterium]
MEWRKSFWPSGWPRGASRSRWPSSVCCPSLRATLRAPRPSCARPSSAPTFRTQNVVQVLDYGVTGGQPYLVMELVDGSDLRRVVNAARAAGDPLSLDEAVYVVAAVADALAYAWDAKGPQGTPLHVVHRDVNPMNVLVSSDGIVKLADFGVARADGRERTQVGLIKGKLGYIAPELAAGREPTHRSDLFLAGALLWELLAGRPLFKQRGSAAQAIGELIAYDDAALGEPAEGTSELMPILRRALAKDPSGRYEHARQLAESLREVLSRRGSRVGPEQLAARVRRLFPDRVRLDTELKGAGRPLREDAAAPPSRTAPKPSSSAVKVAPAPPGGPAKRQRLGEMLVERGVITASQLQTILQRQRREGGRVGEWAIEARPGAGPRGARDPRQPARGPLRDRRETARLRAAQGASWSASPRRPRSSSWRCRSRSRTAGSTSRWPTPPTSPSATPWALRSGAAAARCSAPSSACAGRSRGRTAARSRSCAGGSSTRPIRT